MSGSGKFSMKDVTVLTKRKNERIREVFAMLSNDYRLTEPVLMALNIYVEFILKVKGYNRIKLKWFEIDLNNMLSHNCNKNSVLITKYDVEQAEPYILADIKRAIALGGLRYLKYDKNGSDELKHIAEVLLEREIAKNNSTRIAENQKSNFGTKMTKEDMERFLTELEVI